MTPKQEAAMQQALDALQIMKSYGNNFGYRRNERNPYGVVCDALESLREALAEPVQEPVPVQLPEDIGYVPLSADGTHIFIDGVGEVPLDFGAMAEPVKEPVTWNWMLDGRPYGQAYYGNPPDADIAERAAISGRTVRLLYAKPFGSKPLTDEEIYLATNQIDRNERGWAMKFARAIEAAHGIKENT